MLRISVFVFTIFVAFVLSACDSPNPPAGETLSISKQTKTDVYKNYTPDDVTWRELIPEGYELEYQYQSLYPWMTETEATESSDEALASTPIVEALDQQDVRISGYVVPLSSDVESISEFLLVPVEGACLHIPAPPANQIVHVKPHYPLPMGESYGVLSVVGTMTSSGISSSIAAASYSIDSAILEPYVAIKEETIVASSGHLRLDR